MSFYRATGPLAEALSRLFAALDARGVGLLTSIHDVAKCIDDVRNQICLISMSNYIECIYIYIYIHTYSFKNMSMLELDIDRLRLLSRPPRAGRAGGAPQINVYGAFA